MTHPTDPTMTAEDARQLEVLADATDGQLSARYRRVLATYDALAEARVENARLHASLRDYAQEELASHNTIARLRALNPDGVQIVPLKKTPALREETE